MMNERLNRIGRRLVIGQDITRIQEHYELTLLDITFLMGNYGGRFYKLVTPENLGKPLSSVARCLLIRLITDWSAEGKNFPARADGFTWSLLIPRPPAAQEYNDLVLRYRHTLESHWPAFSASNIGVLLGMSGVKATERWVGDDSSPQPVVQRLMTYLVADIRSRGEPALIDHMRRVELEAQARRHLGIDDLLRTSRWNNVKDVEELDQKRPKRRRRAANPATRNTASWSTTPP